MSHVTCQAPFFWNISNPLLKIKPQQKLSSKPPLQTIFFKSCFFFSFNLKVKEQLLILDILIVTCVNFYTLILLNKILLNKTF